jgi:hypothetical protein
MEVSLFTGDCSNVGTTYTNIYNPEAPGGLPASEGCRYREYSQSYTTMLDFDTVMHFLV